MDRTVKQTNQSIFTEYIVNSNQFTRYRVVQKQSWSSCLFDNALDETSLKKLMATQKITISAQNF